MRDGGQTQRHAPRIRNSHGEKEQRSACHFLYLSWDGPSLSAWPWSFSITLCFCVFVQPRQTLFMVKVCHYSPLSPPLPSPSCSCLTLSVFPPCFCSFTSLSLPKNLSCLPSISFVWWMWRPAVTPRCLLALRFHYFSDLCLFPLCSSLGSAVCVSGIRATTPLVTTLTFLFLAPHCSIDIRCTNYSTVACCGSISVPPTHSHLQSVTCCWRESGQTQDSLCSFRGFLSLIQQVLENKRIEKLPTQQSINRTSTALLRWGGNNSVIRSAAGYLMHAHEMKSVSPFNQRLCGH